MIKSDSTCIDKQSEPIVKLLKEQGYWPLEEAWALVQREPGKHTPLSAWPYAPGMLDLIEEWLTNLPK